MWLDDRRNRQRKTTLLGHVAERRRAIRPPLASSLASVQQQAEIEEDLRLARDIQQGLLLQAVPRLPGWEMSAISIPARVLGGDLYDFLPMEAHQHSIMIGDVSGKGLAAALRMAVTRTIFRHEARRGLTVGETLMQINNSILTEIPQGMVTMLYASLDLQTGQLELANAGHNFPVLISSAIQEVELPGLPLGIDRDSDYQELTLSVGYGDTVVFYTDGLVEKTDSQDELFGFERLLATLTLCRRMKPRALVSALLHEIRLWGSGVSDDITIVVLRRRLLSVGAELRSIAEDVLGQERTAAVWEHASLPPLDAPVRRWAAMLPSIAQLVQERYGRGFARELQMQWQMAVEEYQIDDIDRA